MKKKVNLKGIPVKSRWRRPADGYVARVLAVVEGYVVMRFPGWRPFVLTGEEFLAEYQQVESRIRQMRKGK